MRNHHSGFVKPLIIILCCILVLMIGIFAVAFFLGGDRDMGTAVDFTATDINGDEIVFSELYQQQGVALIFYDPSEQDTTALLKNLSAAKKGKNVTTVLVTPKDASTITKFLTKNKLTPDRVITDTDARIQNLYNVSAFPTTYFVRKDGSVRGSAIANLSQSAAKKYIGYIDN